MPEKLNIHGLNRPTFEKSSNKIQEVLKIYKIQVEIFPTTSDNSKIKVLMMLSFPGLYYNILIIVQIKITTHFIMYVIIITADIFSLIYFLIKLVMKG